MPKQLYPKPPQHKPNRQKEDLSDRPYHVEYSDPDGLLEPEWGHYNTELGVKVGAWYNSRFLGFRRQAVLFEKEELPNE